MKQVNSDKKVYTNQGVIRQSLEEILPLVRQPSRYLGSEINAVKKDLTKVQLRFALAFPDLYEVGMSHLGLQIIYYILNQREEIAAERVFAPDLDMESHLREKRIPLMSLETKTPLRLFDIIGFSLLYELNYTNILTILELGHIPFYTKERDSSHPFVIAGGPCTFNPEPLAEFFDAFVIGDGEDVVLRLCETYLAWKNGGGDREELLKVWSDIEGVYIPSFFSPRLTSDGIQTLVPRSSDYSIIKRSVVPDLGHAIFPDKPIVPFGKPIHDRLSLEIARGCTQGCRFCQAGIIYRPVRERSPDAILNLALHALAKTGFDEISLLSLSTGDYSSIQSLLKVLMTHCEPEKIAISLPSLRVGTLTPNLMAQIKRVRKTGFTIAPEAGSERLRKIINKNITEDELEITIRNAFALGWRLIKLYFMIGLPTETERDVDSIASLVHRLQRVTGKEENKGNINVSVSTFIPKAHTPFQWADQLSLEKSEYIIQRLKGQIQGRKIRFKWQNPKMSLLEGLFARGDRRLGRLLIEAYRLGCRLDGWSDHFRYDLWERAMERCQVDIDFYTSRQRKLSEPLPWDHIDSGVKKDFLESEWKKALIGETTDDCRKGICNQCGVCDFEELQMRTFKRNDTIDTIEIEDHLRPIEERGPYLRFCVTFEKRGEAKYFGHLELAKIFIRAFRRAHIHLKFTQGFHPMPRISFTDALPIGIESVREYFFVEVYQPVTPDTLIERLNKTLPQGLRIIECKLASKKSQMDIPQITHYTVTLRGAMFSEDKLRQFLESKTWPLKKINRKGYTTKLDLKKIITSIMIDDPDTVKMSFSLQPGQTLRPIEVLANIFDLPEDVLKQADIIKG